MDITEAIRRAEQWRKDGACGPAAVVAIALLNELQRMQKIECATEVVRAMNATHGRMFDLVGDAIAERRALTQAQSKTNDDMLAAQRNLLLREDGYPNAPVLRKFAGPAHKSAVAISEQWFKQKLDE